MKHLLYILLVLVVVSCEKEEEPYDLPDIPPGTLTKVEADIGTDYSKAVYISLANNTQQTRNWKDWDLAFEASETGGNIYLNTGKFMFACHTGSTDFATADSTGKEWRIDNDALQDDSNAIGAWWNILSGQEVMVIDRGRVFYTGVNASQRYKKIKVQSMNNNSYVISFGTYGSTQPTQFIINKDHNHSLMYFSFDNGGQVVNMSPPKDEWDFVLTRYTHIFYNEPVYSIYRYYLVNGGLNNKWNGITGVRMIKGATQGYIPFNEITGADAVSFDFSADANIIGYDWKMVDTNTGIYNIVPDVYYILKDKHGYLYKLRFLDFYDSNGNRGHITFDYQRL